MKTKLLFIIGGLGVGGKERQLIEIINNLPQEKYEVQLIIKEINGYYYELIDKQKCKIHNVDWKGYRIVDHLQSIKYIKKVIKVVNEFKPNFVVSFSIEMSYLYLIASTFIFNRPKLVNFTIRDAPIKLNNFLKFKRFSYNFLKYVVANSKAGLKAYRQENLKDRYVLYNGLNKNRIPKLSKQESRIASNLPEDSFIVTFVGKQDKRKDHNCFMNAASIISKKQLNILFVIVGDGSEFSKNNEFAESLGLEKDLIFVGMSKIVELYLRGADINILCSTSWHGEGIPNSVLESFACNTTVIATDNGGTKEIVINNLNGMLIENGDYIDLADKILYLYYNKDVINNYSQNAYLTYKKHFSIKTMIFDFENILNKIYA